MSIAYHGNIADLREYAVKNEIHLDLLSDQTSCHAVYEAYCPQGITFEERTKLLTTDQNKLKKLVDKRLRHHSELMKTLVKQGTFFFDYGNSFMKAVYDAGVREIAKNGIEDIMNPELFDCGYCPFCWVCFSGKEEDLIKTDRTAMECINHNRRGRG